MLTKWSKPVFAPDGGDGAAVEGEPVETPSFEWGELDEDLKGFIGDMSPMEVAKAGFSHKQGATRREEQIRDSLMDDADFAAKMAEKHGMVSAPKDDKAFMEMAKSRISEDTEYKRPEIDLPTPDGVLDTWAKAAREAGVTPTQHEAMVKTASEGIKAYNEAAYEAALVDIKAQEGENYEENNVQIENLFRALGGEAEMAKMIYGSLPPEMHGKARAFLASQGKAIGTGEISGDALNAGGSTSGGSGDVDADFTAAKEEMAKYGYDRDKAPQAVNEEYDRAYFARQAATGKK